MHSVTRRWTGVCSLAAAVGAMCWLAESTAAPPPGQKSNQSSASSQSGAKAAKGKKRLEKMRSFFADRKEKEAPEAKLVEPKRGKSKTTDIVELAAEIDDWIDAKLESESVPASPACSDEAFLRRASLDIIGRIPERQLIKSFLADSSSDKRVRLVDELLESPEYGQHFGTIWHHLLIVPNDDNRQLIAASFGVWMAEQFNKNRSWNDIVFEILTASGSRDDNPAIVFFLSHVEGAQQRELKPQEIAGAATQRFLGVQYQCAECHVHPFTGFKQEDFWSIAAFFSKTEADNINKRQAKSGAVPSVVERAAGQKPTIDIPETQLKPSPPKLPGSRTVSSVNKAGSLRGTLAGWMTAPSNKDFSRAAVNRLWSHFLGRGFVNPVDDFRKDNPASHPEALDRLAAEFSAAGGDLKHAIRVICATKAYQRSSDAVAENAEDETYFSHMLLKQMSTDVLYRSITTALGKEITRANLNEKINSKKGARVGTKGEFLKFFNTSIERDSLAEYTHGIPQALRLMNGEHLLDGNPTLKKIMAESKTKAAVVEELFLATLCRKPTSAEQSLMLRLLSQHKDPTDGYRAVQWVLLNGSEFVLIH